MLGRSVLIAALSLLPGLVVGRLAFGQASESASYIRLLYKKYLDTEPSAVDLNYWMNQMQQGVTAVDLQAVVIGSDAYLNRHRGDLTSWINGVYAEVLSRNPTPAEVQSDLARLRQLGNRRVDWAKEFLRNNGGVPASLSNPSAGIASSTCPGGWSTPRSCSRKPS